MDLQQSVSVGTGVLGFPRTDGATGSRNIDDGERLVDQFVLGDRFLQNAREGITASASAKGDDDLDGFLRERSLGCLLYTSDAADE